jgi:phage minor structural protein
MIPILYDKSEENFTRNGIGFLTDAISCEVTEERNGSYELSISYPITGNIYAYINEGNIIKCKANDTSDPQLFRIYSCSKPLNGIVSIKAEHISYDLNGIPIAELKLKSATAQMAITKAISDGAFESKFKALSDIATLNTIDLSEPCSIRATLGGQQGSVLDIWGGEYEFDNYVIKLHSHRGSDTGVTIEYGKNLTDIKQDKNITATYTHIMPYATYTEQKDDGNGKTTSEDKFVYLKDKVLPINEAAELGHKKAYIINLSDQFSAGDEITPATLRTKAETYLKAHTSLGVPSVSITASFVSLWQTEEYKNIAPLEKVKLCDTVTVKFAKLGVSAKAKVIKTVYDVLAEKYKSIELGDAKSNFAQTVLDQNKAIAGITTLVKKGLANASTELKEAIKNATNLITGNSGGYVVLHPAESPQEILILDSPDIESAVRVWRWNSAGLGYSKNGYNGDYGLAITMNGAIVADFITVGTLNGALLAADSVQANAISQGFKKSIEDNITGAKKSVEQAFKLADEELESTITTSYTDAISTAESSLKTLISQTADSITLSVSKTLESYAKTEDVTAAIEVSENNITQTVSTTYATRATVNNMQSTMNTMQSSITQNSQSISLKVSKSNLVSEINQSAGTIKLTSNRFVVESDNFKLTANGTVTASKVNLTGSLKTETYQGYYSYIHDGVIECFLNDNRVAYIMPVISTAATQYAILGSGNYDGVAIGARYDNLIETYYRCNIQDAYTNEGCRHHFVGTVKFDNRFQSKIDFENNVGVSWGGNTGLRYLDSGTYGNGLYLGITANSCNTYVVGNSITMRCDTWVQNHSLYIRKGYLDIDDGCGICCTGTIAFRWVNGNGLFVGMDAYNLKLVGSNIYANGSPVAVTSDERKKENIVPLSERYLSVIKNITPVSFNYTSDIALSGRTHTGFTAQNVLEAMNKAGISASEFAAFVDVDGDGKEYALRYEEFVPLLLAYIKDLENRIINIEKAG